VKINESPFSSLFFGSFSSGSQPENIIIPARQIAIANTFLILNAKLSQQSSTRYAVNQQHNPWDLRTNNVMSLTFSIKLYDSFVLGNFHFQSCCDVQELRFLSAFFNLPQRPHDNINTLHWFRTTLRAECKPAQSN
jgi:hypothetical protein